MSKPKPTTSRKDTKSPPSPKKTTKNIKKGKKSKMYRIKNIKTGLYYQPSRNGNNLSKKGKIYQTKTNILNMGWSDYVGISISRRSRVYSLVFDHYLKNGCIDWDGKTAKEVPEYENIRTHIPKTDFIIEKI